MQTRIAGCDLGKASAKLVTGRVGDDGAVVVDDVELVVHEGDPLGALRAWYRRADVAGCRALAATGMYASELAAPVVSGLPEDACLAAALALTPELDGPLNLVSVGARGYAVLTRNAQGRVAYLENDKCSSGTGETMVKIAARFGLTIEEADRLARAAETAIPITARCSVFAKSEMTHFGNQGRPADALFRGYFGAVATYVAALLARARVPGPVAVIGGGARIGALVDALGRVLGEPVTVPARPQHLEALGALALAAEQARTPHLAALPADPDAVIRVEARRFRTLAPARAAAARVTRLEAAPVPAGAAAAPTVLGLDLGSTGSKAALTSLATGELVLDLYDRTRGNPAEAARRLCEALAATGPLDVRAIALTGSGREAAATVMRAAFPEHAARIVVENEIVAHATAAIRCAGPDARSLSVVEIGGQDAKFIDIRDGHIVESDMNKACSAGTGSFLEEQAAFYGVHDIGEFTRLATLAERPPDLGQMCTVFVADAAAEALRTGASVPDLFGGFQYSVIHNYINRVMGQRTFGDRIFFQGKPASGPSLAWTLAAVTGADVTVPPNPGAMGAWGIGLCAVAELGAGALAAAPAIDLGRVLGATVVARSEFQCREKACATLCRIEKTTVAVGGAQEVVLSGGACPKYEISSAARPKLPVDAPSPFDERAALLAPFLAPDEAPAAVGAPVIGAAAGVVPWLVTLLRALGLPVRPLASDARSLARGEERCFSFDACAPVKIAHGVADADVATLFFPKLLDLVGGKTCPMEQAVPEMVREALRAAGRDVRVVHPALALGDLASAALRPALVDAVTALGADVRRLDAALAAARAAQRRYDDELTAIGARALAWARAHGAPAVVVCGSLHVIHDRAINADIPRLLRDHGVIPVPMDAVPLDGVPALDRVMWADAARGLRAALAARARGDAYPLLLTAFGCGPASFSEQVFGALMEGYPHTTLESDGHGGTAGYVTRVQAFLHAVRRHDRRPSPVRPDRLALCEDVARPPVTALDGKLVVFGMTDRLSPLIAGVYRSFGVDAVAAPAPDAEGLARGRRDCSGKECLPYQLMWGSFRTHLEAAPPTERTTLLQVRGDGMCRNCMFSIKDRISLERMGAADRVSLRHFGGEPELGTAFMLRLCTAMIAWDLLFQLASYHRALDGADADVDALYARHAGALEALIAAPARPGLRGIPGHVRLAARVARLVDTAAAEYAALARRRPEPPGLRTILLSGDIYLRFDEAGSDRLVRRLAARGLRPVVEPTSALFEYLALERSSELLGLPSDPWEAAEHRVGMVAIRRALYARARRLHPWLPSTDAAAAREASRALIDRFPQGEAPVTIGSVLHLHERFDGVVLVGPWGCGPSLITESLLRHRTEIPTLFVYCDGSPVDERRLGAFAFRLRRTPARAPARA